MSPRRLPAGLELALTDGALALAAPPPADSNLVVEHCPLPEYFQQQDAWFGDRPNNYQRQWAATRFQATYPDLQAWLTESLAVRAGWPTASAPDEPALRRRTPNPDLSDEQTRGLVSYHARAYLHYLVFTDRLRLDWRYLLAVQSQSPWLVADRLGLRLRAQLDDLTAQRDVINDSSRKGRDWFLSRLVLHRGDANLQNITDEDVEGLHQAILTRGQDPELAALLAQRATTQGERTWASFYFNAALALYHAKITSRAPERAHPTTLPPELSVQPRVDAVMQRYVQERLLVDRASTVAHVHAALRRLADWLAQHRPQVAHLGELRRTDTVEFLRWVQQLPRADGAKTGAHYQRHLIWCVVAFFRRIAEAEYDDAPTRVLLLSADIPRQVERVPRYIPAEELGPLMEAVHDLEDPVQRAALLLLRWSGARRDEIRRLTLDCLDSYADGTARLRLPAGKSRRERTVPLHHDAAEALAPLIAARRRQPDRPLPDLDSGQQAVRHVFLRKGRLASADYLFQAPLKLVCTQAGLVDNHGKPTIHAHRFRHTLGTQMGERGARTQTIMKVLGHRSASMAMTYTHISDPTVLADYRAVVTPGAPLAGPLSETIRNGGLNQDALDWLKTNFIKTELELGRCLRLPQEGPCECDLYLTCAKFVTTPDYAPRLRDRQLIEEQLIEDARERGWDREVERHQRVADRVAGLLAELRAQSPSMLERADSAPVEKAASSSSSSSGGDVDQ